MSKNSERSERIYRLVLVYRQYAGEGLSDDEVLVDLLTDLRHWCDEYAEDFEHAVALSEVHFDAETSES